MKSDTCLYHVLRGRIKQKRGWVLIKQSYFPSFFFEESCIEFLFTSLKEITQLVIINLS